MNSSQSQFVSGTDSSTKNSDTGEAPVGISPSRNVTNDCAKKYLIDRRIISRWIKAEAKILKTKLKRKNMPVDWSYYPSLENHLYTWVKEKRLKGCCLSGTTIKLEAAEIHNTLYANTNESGIEFKASNGWFVNFCRRKNLVLRRVTTNSRDLPKNAFCLIKSLFRECQVIVNSVNYKPGIIFNMDETCIYLDLPLNYTYEEKGATFNKTGATFNECVLINYIKTILVPYMLENTVLVAI
ncbi:pogo transposable element with KRAB domain [Brachionus plicatilis]|uniref:Pogo transposable element with KRAB domain n=1 Tax=Brachionus plicatilis TaxID=10195 RepID=A0A3M7Q6V0_BRAPC|nr:pogo transposable element with KRAB domain [Brachionus plicatilis]